MEKFKDRRNAGKKLAADIRNYDLDLENAVCLGLPRGGVPVAHEVAQDLDIPLDVIISRKVGAPFNPEFAIGAISEKGASYYNQSTISSLNIDSQTLDKIEEEEKAELQRRIDKYRRGKSLPSFEGKVVLLVDDGLATGATARAAIGALEKMKPESIIFCSPVCAYETSQNIKKGISEVICTLKPKALSAIGFYYDDFGQTSDDEVLSLLNKSKRLIE